MANHIVLVHPAIPQNTGNIMRSCVAGGASLHLIKPLGFSLDDKHMKRSGLDYVQYLNYTVYENWEEFLSKNEGEFYFLTRYSKKCYSDFNLSDSSKNHYFVLGHEHDGIPHEILKDNLERCMRIPMSGNVRSLNLSNCAMMILYEALRQQDFPNLSKVEVQKGEDFIYE
jgi:tRNA (cytidine/uridine-2'-O-)-methyltransferase